MFSGLFGRGRSDDLTDNVPVVSHTHGRERRAERGISKNDLQAAVKHGRKERANPGRRGEIRWRFTHRSIVYITDESMKHEITSWRLDNALGDIPRGLANIAGANGHRTHTVLVVDHSGSMRKNDVPGFASRTQAVYDCLVTQLLRPQLQLSNAADAAVSLITMQDECSVEIFREPVRPSLVARVEGMRNTRAAYHGFYLPALRQLHSVLMGDLDSSAQLYIIFLSDGAASDHIERVCDHGVAVWQEDSDAGRLYNGNKTPLQSCGDSTCRRRVKKAVHDECLEVIEKLGDRWGRDRVALHTVAFGPPSEDYSTLEQMAEVLPRGSFHRLGLDLAQLTKAFSTLSSGLTTLRTGADVSNKTLRKDVKPEKKEDSLGPNLKDGSWDIYLPLQETRFSERFLTKQKYSLQRNRFDDVPLHDGAVGVAQRQMFFAEGVERHCFYCSEISEDRLLVGPVLVAKEARHNENVRSVKFHQNMCKITALASHYADLFNRRVASANPMHSVSFSECWIYGVFDTRYNTHDGHAWILAEKRLEGEFIKWNNNGEYVRTEWSFGPHAGAAKHRLRTFTIEEESEEDESDDDDEEEKEQIRLIDIPQAFSHFTWSASNKELLVCDIQGVWNTFDGFVCTDPAIHSGKDTACYGSTDKGRQGMATFFKHHKCSSLCRRLGLEQFRAVSRVKIFKCSHCPKSFSNRQYGSEQAAMDARDSHEQDHEQDHMYACDVCDRSFFVCDYRDADAAQEACLQHEESHKRRHAAVFTCDVCDKSFSEHDYRDAETARRAYLQHKQSHPDVYSCDVCDREFFEDDYRDSDTARRAWMQHERMCRG